MDEQDKPRPRALTLAGVGSPSGPPVVGAVARPSAPGPSEVTTRMIFAPSPVAEPRTGSEGAPGDAAGIDDQWPDEPPTVEPVQLATVPPAPLPSTATPATPAPRSVQRSRHGVRWVALAALVFFAGAIGLRIHRSGAPPVATPGPPTEVAATASAAAMPPTPASAPEPAAPSVAESPPPAAPAIVEPPPPAASVVAESPPPGSPAMVSAFDPGVAKQALDATASAVARCRRGNVFGSGHAIVTFGNDGAVRHTAVSPPFLGTAAGMCVARALAQARVPAFAGKPSAAVVHPFVVPAN